MKVVNGSHKMMQAGNIDFGLKEVRLGNDIRAEAAAGVLTIGFILPFFDAMPGRFWQYWVGFFVLAIIVAIILKDEREKYQLDMIDKIFVGPTNKLVVGEASGGSALGGAAVGGLIFGGAGAIVGAIAGANSKDDTIEETCSATVKFRNGEWAVVEGSPSDIKMLVLFSGNKNVCPV